MELTIANVGIKQDEAGRYCLNDLHQSAGAEAKHQPANWLRNKQTQELIDELAKIPQIRGIEVKQGLGTFVCKELVYSYAMWISPAFHLKVIRTFDAVVTHQLDPLQALNDPAAMRGLLLGYAEKVIERDKLISYLQPQAEALTRLSKSDGSLCITDAAKTLQIPPKQLFSFLSANKWIYRRTGTSWIAYQDKIQQGLLEHKITTVERTDGTDKLTEQVRITPKGLSKIAAQLTPTLMAA